MFLRGSLFISSLQIIMNNTSPPPSVPWYVKHAPKHIRDFVGNATGVAVIRDWLATFHSRRKLNPTTAERCLLLSGPIGVGKTLSVRLLSRHFGCRCEVLNAASRTNKKRFLDHISTTLTRSTTALFDGGDDVSTKQESRPAILVIEEINAIVSSGKGSSELKALLTCLANACTPLICITDDRGEEGIRRLVSVATRVEFTLPSRETISNFLCTVLKRERAGKNKDLCDRIAIQTHGDVRKALLQLQTHVYAGHSSSPQLPPLLSGCEESMDDYMHFFDTYGSQTIYHTMEHYAFRYVGKKRGRKPTKKTCYSDNVCTTTVSPHQQHWSATKCASHRALVADALSFADTIRHNMLLDYADQELIELDNVAPYLAYASCGVAFKMAESPIPLDRVDFPSHTSTCKRYLSSLRTLLDRTRSALFQFNDVSPACSIFMTPNDTFCELHLPLLKHILSKPMIARNNNNNNNNGDDNRNGSGVNEVLRLAQFYRFNMKDIEFIMKCACYSGQPRINKYIDKQSRIELANKLKSFHESRF